MVSGNDEDDGDDNGDDAEIFGADLDDDEDGGGGDDKFFAPPFSRLAKRLAALLLFVVFDTLSVVFSLVAGVPGCCCLLNCFVFDEATLLLASGDVATGANVFCCCRCWYSLLLVDDIWRCIELAAAAANKAARVVPPSVALLGGEGETAVGEAVIVSGASLFSF